MRPLPPHQIVVRQVIVGLLYRRHASYPHPFYQPVLGRPEIPFYSSLGLRGMRGDPGDTQFPQRAADLRWRHFHSVFVHPWFIAFPFPRRLK